ncbi:hypothetical protein CBR_g36758 [Chara braunii]|uniref:Protein kinase domain-containing protein n=1 Tax=Chara braunii TaxID=69332 RepID=A0A388LLD6_CHABU|nr:hypothetical protein CBR_g36758 [Chara braunii]|eukprot:GBG83140.1 hypothetical protein CBR_g36758 [Chara braunii]
MDAHDRGATVRVAANGCSAERDGLTGCDRSEERGSSCWFRGSVLGQGSFGRVHHALDRRSCAVFAVKTVGITPEAVGDPGSPLARASMAELRALENEITILRRLGPSPHVVKYLGDDWTVGQDGSSERNLLLELANGGSMAEFSKRFGGKLDESMIRRCCRGILRGLQHAHSQGVVHRDVKGQNVLVVVDEEGGVTAKLSDFGASACVWGNRGASVDGQSQGSSIQLGTVSPEEVSACPRPSVSLAGTVQWMAPEVAGQSGTLEAASDIWSLGCTVIEMATGRAPWTDVEDAMSALFRIACTDESSHPAGFPNTADLTPVGSLVSSRLGGGKEREMEDAVEEGGEIWERLTRTSCSLKAPEQEASPRLVFDLPTSSGSELSLDAANRVELVAAAFRQGEQASLPHGPVDGVGWECRNGGDKQTGLTGGTASLLTERQEGEVPVKGNLRRLSDVMAADEALAVGISRRLSAVRRRPWSKGMSRDVFDNSGAGGEKTAASDKAEDRLRRPMIHGMLPPGLCGEWIQVLSGTRKQGRGS